MITAHSGCDNTKPNSIDFVQYALSLPADAFEVDVRKNTFGELIISHDEAEGSAPLLSEVFDLLKEHPEKKINCDLKQEHIEVDVVLLAEKYGVHRQLIFTGSVDRELFKKGNVAFSNVEWYFNISTMLLENETFQTAQMTDLEITQKLEQILERTNDYEVAGLNWHYSNAQRVWEKARSMGIGISVWTVDDVEQQKIWLEREVENITSRKITQLIDMRKC